MELLIRSNDGQLFCISLGAHFEITSTFQRDAILEVARELGKEITGCECNAYFNEE